MRSPSRALLNVIRVVFRKLICDSRSSDSFAERSTVDYIVPGEMELMSAVRSVSCNSSMSKCNKTEVEEEEYGPNGEGPPLIDSLFVKQPGGDCPPPPPPPSGSNLSCSNPDLVQVRRPQISDLRSNTVMSGHQVMGEELTQGSCGSHDGQLPDSQRNTFQRWNIRSPPVLPPQTCLPS